MKRRTLIGWTLMLIGLMALPAWAEEYRLQVAKLDYRGFASYQEHPPSGGMWVVVGRGDPKFNTADRVYVLIEMAPEPRTYKLVIGWRHRPDGRTGPGFSPLFEDF